MIIAPDKWLLERTQEGYLWLLDRTGVYCATLRIVFIFASFAPVIIHDGLWWGQMALMTLWAVAHGVGYYEQDTKKYAEYNSSAMAWEGSWVRTMVFHPVAIGVLAANGLTRDYWEMIFVLLQVAWSYLSTVTIRDREPPEEEQRDLAYDQSF